MHEHAGRGLVDGLNRGHESDPGGKRGLGDAHVVGAVAGEPVEPVHDAKLHTGRRYERHDKHSADRDQQSADLTANRAGLEAESDELLAAHFADAIDLGALKRHQDRIRAGLADIERRLTSATDRLPTASSDAHASPNRSRPSSPNQSRNDLQEHPPSSDVTGSRKTLWVELRGFEPLTSSMPWKRATNCAIAPRTCITLQVPIPRHKLTTDSFLRFTPRQNPHRYNHRSPRQYPDQCLYRSAIRAALTGAIV